MDASHQSFLYLSYVAMHSDGIIQDQEDTLLKQIIELENISKSSLDEFSSDIKKKSLKEMLKIGLDGLMNAHRKDQIKALAWIHKMILADDKVDVKEAQFLMNSFKPTDISYGELTKVAQGLPEI